MSWVGWEGMRQISCLSTTVIPALQLASLSEKDTSHISRLVPRSLRGESVAVEDGVILSLLPGTKVIRLVVDVAMITEGDEMILTAPYLNRKGS